MKQRRRPAPQTMTPEELLRRALATPPMHFTKKERKTRRKKRS